MDRHTNSAQRDWLRHPHLTWRTAFPLFTAMWEGASSLLWHETRMLVLTAAGMTAFTFVLVLDLAFFTPSWGNYSWMQAAENWTLAAVALVGVWTSLGQGDWHVRFPLGALAAAWIAVVHVVAAHAMGSTMLNSFDGLCTLAASTFAVSAFGGGWLRSLGRWELAGPRPGESASRLRVFQFSTATLFSGVMLTAAVLGLWQIATGLGGLVTVSIRQFNNMEAGPAILLATMSALAAYVVMFGGTKRALAVAAALVALLTAADYFGLTSPAMRFRLPMFTRIPLGALFTGAISLAWALVPLLGLRLAGFHLQRTNLPPRVKPQLGARR